MCNYSTSYSSKRTRTRRTRNKLAQEGHEQETNLTFLHFKEAYCAMLKCSVPSYQISKFDGACEMLKGVLRSKMIFNVHKGCPETF